MKKSWGIGALLIAAVCAAQAGNAGAYCWQTPRSNGGTCILKLDLDPVGGYGILGAQPCIGTQHRHCVRQGQVYGIQGMQFCNGDDPGDTHVFGNMYIKDGKFQAGLTSVGLSDDKTNLWHSGGIFEIEPLTLDAVLYWTGDTVEKCDGATPPCLVQQPHTRIFCPLTYPY